MEIELAEQPASEAESEIEITAPNSPRQSIHRAKFPLNSPMDRARDSLIGNRNSEIAAPVGSLLCTPDTLYANPTAKISAEGG